jgi:hypothetical protein
MGAIGEQCCFDSGELPTLEIPGMHNYTGWVIAGCSDRCRCCASMIFEYDVEQAYVKHDGGDVMSYDKTTTKTYEAFYYPETCGARLKGWYTDPNSGGYPGEEHYPTEPAYTGCCPSAVTLNTTIIADRIRGGRRFVLRFRPFQIKITIQKATITCAGITAQKYIVTSEKFYTGQYEYVDYQQTSSTATSSSGKACWQLPSSVSGVYPFDISTWSPGAGSVATGFSFCARKHFETLPTSGSFAFSVGDTGEDCDDPVPDCAPCAFAAEVCFDSGATGITEPSSGFCTAPASTTQNYTLTHAPRCRQHKWSRFYRGNDAPGGGGYFFPGRIDDFTDQCKDFAGTSYPPANCTRNFSYVGIAPGGIGGGGMVGVRGLTVGVITSPSCDVWALVCANCYANGAYENTDPGTTTENYDVNSAYARVVAASVALTCSGYVRRNLCVAFSSWSIPIA